MSNKGLFNPLVCIPKENESYITVGEARKFLDNFDDEDILIIAKSKYDEDNGWDSDIVEASPIKRIEESVFDIDELEMYNQEQLDVVHYGNIRDCLEKETFRKCLAFYPAE